MPAAALDPSAITAALTADELGQTVEEYLRAQCAQRVESLKRHMDERICEFEQGVKRGRQALVEIANPPAQRRQASPSCAQPYPSSSGLRCLRI